MKKITISLDESTLAALDRVATNRSGYITHIIERRTRETTEALSTLRSRMWTRNEVAAVAKVLLGSFVEMSWGPSELAHELHDAGTEKIHVEYGIGGDRWAALISQVKDSPILARCIIHVAQEWSVGNTVVRGVSS